METKIVKPTTENLIYASKLLKENYVIGFPTETVYGLGANAFSIQAVSKIFEAKNRPADNPLIVHIDDINKIKKITYPLNDIEQKLVNAFWPGPLSIVLKAKKEVPKIVTAGLDTVAIRMPAHPVARELIKLSDLPIAAPSANISGRPSATSSKHVFNDFNGKIPMIIDGGTCQFGLESTVVRVLGNQIVILRPGAITAEMLSEIALTEYSDLKNTKVAIAPGMKHPHYHPNAKIILVTGINDKEIKDKIDKKISYEKRVAFYGFKGIVEVSKFTKHFEVDGKDRLYDYAQSLYSFFRECDEDNVEEIVIHQVPKKGLGYAIMNRIKKAADQIV
jgi:L-threonylcarbamoyladenylate synthase